MLAYLSLFIVLVFIFRHKVAPQSRRGYWAVGAFATTVAISLTPSLLARFSAGKGISEIASASLILIGIMLPWLVYVMFRRMYLRVSFPPNAEGTDERAALKKASMRESLARPIAHWIVLIIGTAAALAIAHGLYGVLMWMVAHAGSHWRSQVVAFELGWRGVAFALIAWMLVAVFRGARGARVLGLVFIALLLAICVRVQIVQEIASSPELYHDPALGRSAEAVGGLLVIASVIYWFYSFGFSSRAREYFRARKLARETQSGS